MLVFHTLSAALACGYHVFDRTREGYLVRIRLPKGYALARVII
jgi:hypothetical protein